MSLIEATIADRPLIRPTTLVAHFPITSFVPGSACPHRGSYPRGSSLCCMVCHASGKDDHPGLKRDRFTDPKPEPTAEDVEERVGKAGPPRPPTRKERRRAAFRAAADHQLAMRRSAEEWIG